MDGIGLTSDLVTEEYTEMSSTAQPGTGSDRLIEWTPLGIALCLIFSMMPDREEWLYVAGAIGVVASIAVGRTLGKSEGVVLYARVWRFAKGWSLVVAFAALSLLHAKWQPMAFFAVVGIISSILFWLGCKSNG
ncbi:hypothetical protein W02_09170 [Nitrospira sp. KM1]|uniref:hypothetical protein n=1 Tax=Nitrospira sp. KM1 TaxID=1936990 RepID=UPI0013A7979E|nr:hypothetical protein [Nitrospira sp. KM1]BCA53777.1 hypothetical protein W02_09170 [Nitrospira sp. KM1]